MKTRFGAAIGALSITMICLLSSAGTATADENIASQGPLKIIYLGETLDCQVDHVGSLAFEFFGETPGACGTFIALSDATDPEEAYGPDVPAGVPRTPYEPVSQSLTGFGEPEDPYRAV